MKPSLTKLMDILLQRCRLEEDTGCAIWTGAFTMGVCKARLLMGDGQWRVVNVRRAILETKMGKPLGSLLASCRCGNERCIEPSHLKAMTRAQVQQRSSEHGLFLRPHVRAARIAAGRKRATISIETARSIRSASAAGESQASIAKRLGLTQSTIWKVVHNRIAAEAANGASVFNWKAAA